MILFFFHWMQAIGIRIPAVFSYYSTRMMLAAVTSLLLSILLGPVFIRKLYEWKIGQPIRTEDCPLLGQHRLHYQKKDTPTMGGILIITSMLLSMFIWMDLQHVFTLILFVTTIVLACLGARDDYLKLRYKNSKGLSGKKKLMVQVGFSLIIGIYLLYPNINDFFHYGNWFAPPKAKEQIASIGQISLSLPEYISRIYIPFVKDPLFILTGISSIVVLLFIIFVVTGSSNAVNLTDGLDGLAAGCLIMVASCLALIAFISNNIDIAGYLNILYIEGSGEIAIYLAAFAGACLGFLWYNSHPAQVFMGDTGSLALGGIIGVSAVLLKREFLLGIVGGIFVVEALSVIIQVGSYKLRDKKRVFLCAPIHHHFEYKGWPETKVVIRFWIIGLLLAIIGVASLKFQ